MAEIGATLREARMRQRIDITDMEVRTKIRAKYLRALENEEWDLLPGPTYVRSFLRTYAEALGLDAKLLVEEFKLRSDPLETGELHPMRRPTQRERDKRRQRGGGGGGGGGIPRAAVLGVVLALIVGALYLVGQLGSSDNDSGGETTARTQPTSTGTSSDGNGSDSPSKKKATKKKAPTQPAVVKLQIVPTAAVSVCLVNINGDVLVGNQTLQPGAPSKTFRSKRFRLVLGNNGARLKINGTTREIPPSTGAIAYTITKNGRTELPQSRWPSCAA
jgi:cytoskeleton protein RodZ